MEKSLELSQKESLLADKFEAIPEQMPRGISGKSQKEFREKSEKKTSQGISRDTFPGIFRNTGRNV